LVVRSHMACAMLRKILKPIRHWNEYEPRNSWEPKCIVMVRWKVSYTFVKHVGSTYVEMAWNFFGSHIHPKYGPTQDLRFFWWLFLFLYFSLCGVRQNMVDYRLRTLEFCIDLHECLTPMSQETIWQSLAPFWLFSGVDAVQRIITREITRKFN
jgi:hypothetical protein